MKKHPWLLVPAFIAAAGLAWWLWPAPAIPVAIVAQTNLRGLLGSGEMHAAELYLEAHPDSRIQLVPVHEDCNPEETPGLLAEVLARGVHFLLTFHPSKCALASRELFAGDRALVINAASTTPALTGRDDFLLRIIPDAVQEQRALAAFVNGLPGRRLLVLQDTSNLPYADPAYANFAAALTDLGPWEIVHRKLLVADFRPDDYRELMAADYDALYILAGTFQTAIGNIAQLFHYHHPEAPILLTPWARSPEILETAGAAIDRLILPSPYPSRRQDSAIDDYARRFRARFGYEPHVLTLSVQIGLELLDQAIAAGHDTPAAVKRYLLTRPSHQTSLGPISFDAFGDVRGRYHFIQDLRQELQ